MAEPIAAGTVLGAYRVEDVIGRGGMGIVYRAAHVELGRRAAVKVIVPELADDPTFRRRFVREAQAAAAIDHPNVLPVYDAGESDGLLYLVTRYVDGLDLRELVAATGPLDPGRAASIVSQLAAALDASHSAGLVHRDVKPANALLIPGAGREGQDHAYLTDFGLTKRAGDASMTSRGQFVGTCDYVAPEQIQGEGVDGRADIYSLGCVLHWCLTGDPPFRRDTEMAVLWAHVNMPPPRPTELRPELPERVDEVVATAFAKERSRRFDSAGALAAELREAVGADTEAWDAAPEALAAKAVFESEPATPPETDANARSSPAGDDGEPPAPTRAAVVGSPSDRPVAGGRSGRWRFRLRAAVAGVAAVLAIGAGAVALIYLAGDESETPASSGQTTSGPTDDPAAGTAADRRSRRCGDVSFRGDTEFGAFRIRARGVSCEEARAVAEDSRNEGGGDYFSFDFSCEGTAQGGVLPTTDYECIRAGAEVTFSSSA